MRKRSGRPPRFAAVPNETVDDASSLDLEALGLLTVVLRHRDGYDITLPEIAEKYGYGRDGLAGAWGLLQVARYVIKVKIQWERDNQWSTEVVVYDTPATDDEIKELLASIAEEPNVRTVKLEPPTKTARERAAKHAAKVEAKQKAKPERRKLDYEVPGQSAGESGRGRGRRSGGEDQGSGAAGAAAPAKPPRKSAAPKKTTAKKKEPGRRLTQQEAAAVKQVEAAFPEQLQLPSYRPPVLRDAILEALDSRTADVLVKRVKRRWWKHGYEEAAMPGGKGIGSPIGVAVALVRPSTDCPEPMCEDGVILDSGGPCRTCEQRKEDRKAPVPAQRGGSGEQGDAAPASRRWKCRECHTLGKSSSEAPEDGLCGPCRKEAQEVEAVAARLREDLARADAEREALARERWVELVEDAYREHAEREREAAEERERREAKEQQRLRDAEERRRIQEQIARENPELLAYSQTA